MSRNVLIIGLALAALVLVVTFLQRRPAPETGSPEASAPVRPSVPAIRGKPAPDFALPNLDGTTVQRSDFANKVLLVNFWATWCAPCEIEIPWFVDFQNQYGPEGFEVVGISLDEGGTEPVKEYAAEHGINYTIVMGDEKAAEAFGGVLGLPTTFIIDQEGKFYSMHRGLVGRDIVEEELKTLLNVDEPTQEADLLNRPEPADAS